MYDWPRKGLLRALVKFATGFLELGFDILPLPILFALVSSRVFLSFTFDVFPVQLYVKSDFW